MPDSDRLIRLAGDSKKASGGGLPLPDVFTAVIQELLDHGPQDDTVLVKVIMGKFSGLQEKRVLSIWGTWEEFTADILAQLQDSGIMEPAIGRWYLTLKFRSGKRHVIIPRDESAGRDKDITITVHGKEDRQRLDALTRARLDTRRVQAQLTQAGVRDSGVHAAFAALLRSFDGEVPDEDDPYKAHFTPPAKPGREELARLKYGYDGGPVTRSNNPFGADGLRPCRGTCGRRLPPGLFDVYWDEKNYYLRGRCDGCERQRVKDAKKN